MSPLKRKDATIIATLLVCVCFLTPLAVAGNSPETNTNGLQDILLIEHVPADGLYWNDHKIAEFHVPLFLHYYFKFRALFYPQFIITGNGSFSIHLVEFYLDGVLIGSLTTPPWDFSLKVTVTPFHHSHTYGIKVYFGDGQIRSDNVTIYRLFP